MTVDSSRDRIDFETWNSPIVFSGTCKSANGQGECSEINVWHVYKGKEPFNENLLQKEEQSGFDVNVLRAFHATNLKEIMKFLLFIMINRVE